MEIQRKQNNPQIYAHWDVAFLLTLSRSLAMML